MFNKLQHFSLRIVLLAAVFALLSACATTTYESLRNNVDHYGIPYWKKAADQIQSIRDNVDDRDTSARLDKLNKDLGSIPDQALLQETITASTKAELEANMLWLRWELLTQNADGRFAYYYAYGLARNRTSQGTLMTEAIVFLMLGRLSLSVDAARCDDKSVYPTVKFQMENNPSVRMINEYLAKVPAKQRTEMIMHAVSIEEMRGERKPQAWLCNLGTKAMLQAMNNKENVKVVTSSGNVAANTTTIHVDTSSVAPKFIEDAQWREERKNILANAIRSALPAN